MTKNSCREIAATLPNISCRIAHDPSFTACCWAISPEVDTLLTLFLSVMKGLIITALLCCHPGHYQARVKFYSAVQYNVNFQDTLMNEMKSLCGIQFVLVVTRIFSNPSGFLCRNVKLQLKSQILSFLRKCYFPLPSVWTGLFVATRTSRFRLFIYFRLLDGL